MPSDFGQGIMIPLPKSDKKNGCHKIDSFRGITLSPVVSKIFEHCLMELLCDFLYTDDHQFGFKPKVGCSEAIYTVRYVDDMLIKLTKLGCVIGRKRLSAFMYADDLLLMSPSINELQLMLTVCENE